MKTAKILFIGDPHIKVSNIPETKLLIQYIIEIIEQYNPNLVVCLGDTLHRHNVIDVQCQAEAIRMFREISLRKKLVILIGNHDMPSHTSYLSEIHPFCALKLLADNPNSELNTITIVDTRCEIIYVNDLRFAAVPYVAPGLFEKALMSNPEFDYKVRAVMAHQEFIGCKMDAVYSRGGDVWPNYNPLVISGHIHQYQRLGNNIIYTGTPRMSSFADSNDIDEIYKTVSLFTFTEDSWDELRIPIKIPPKIQFEISANDIYNFEPPLEGSIKIKIVGTYSQNSACKLHPSIKAWKKRGISVVFKDVMDDTISIDLTSLLSSSVSNNKLTFASMFYERVRGDPEKEELYRYIFSELQ